MDKLELNLTSLWLQCSSPKFGPRIAPSIRPPENFMKFTMIWPDRVTWAPELPENCFSTSPNRETSTQRQRTEVTRFVLRCRNESYFCSVLFTQWQHQ